MKRDLPVRPLGTALLTLDDASVHFGAVPALQGISMTLHRGERLALVGANGAGKTTLLRLLHGLVPAEGRRQHDAAARPLVAAMLFQRPFLLHLSVRANVLLALWLRRVPRAERAARCDHALVRVGLAGLSERRARTLVRRRAAAPGAGARLGAAARHPVPRRAHRQPGPERQARGRGVDRRARPRRRDPGDEHAQPRPGQAPVHAA